MKKTRRKTLFLVICWIDDTSSIKGTTLKEWQFRFTIYIYDENGIKGRPILQQYMVNKCSNWPWIQNYISPIRLLKSQSMKHT